MVALGSMTASVDDQRNEVRIPPSEEKCDVVPVSGDWGPPWGSGSSFKIYQAFSGLQNRPLMWETELTFRRYLLEQESFSIKTCYTETISPLGLMK